MEEIFIVFEDHSNMPLSFREARGEFTWSLHECPCEAREGIVNGEPLGWTVLFPMEGRLSEAFRRCIGMASGS
jgi:hypothetical protein